MSRLSFLFSFVTVSSLAYSQAAPVLGVWHLNGKGKAVRFAFRKDRTFSYKGYGSTSSGTWSLKGDSVSLTWVRVDGQKVKPGSVCGTYPLAEGVLRVGRFEYRRS